jgi:ATP-dependent Zn protease
MPKSANFKFILWVVGVALFAFVAGRFVEPGIVGANNKTTITQTTGRGHVSSGQAPTTVQPTQPTQPTGGRGAAVQPAETLSVSELYRLIEEQPRIIQTLTFVNGKNEVIVERDGKPKVTVRVPDDGGKQDLRTRAMAAKIPIAVQEYKVDPVLGFMQYMGPALLIVGVIVLIYFLQRRQAMNAGRGVGSSKAKDASTVDVIKTRFKDVAGCDEAIKELRRVVQGLVGREMYTRFGAELPRGILLVGPPGTGKTLLAKAVAGEAEGSFDITSGSDFVEMYQGGGVRQAAHHLH